MKIPFPRAFATALTLNEEMRAYLATRQNVKNKLSKHNTVITYSCYQM